MPEARQIHPIGLLGRLEAIRAPTMGKARKGMEVNRLVTRPLVPQVVGACADRVRMDKAIFAANRASQRAPSDQASQEAVRLLTFLLLLLLILATYYISLIIAD
jgi:hypothetical protein